MNSWEANWMTTEAAQKLTTQAITKSRWEEQRELGVT